MRHFRTIPNFIEMTDDEILSLPENRDNDIWAGWGLFWLDKLLTRKINPGKHIKLDQQRTPVILGAGPSLEGQINEIEKRKDEVITIGINRACGFYPCDINISFDPATEPDFYNRHNNSDKFLVANTICDPVKFDMFPPGNVAIWQTNPSAHYAPATREADWGVLYSGSNTMIATLHMVYKLGFRRVELFGTDFCFEQREKYYVSGNKQAFNEGNEVQIPVDGKMKWTNGNLIKHARNVGATIYWLEQAGMDVVSKTPGLLEIYMKLFEGV